MACLTMIVGNESEVILRCLDSVYKYIDAWNISWNGSDDTPQKIEHFFKEKNIPGELHHHPWKNFRHNRSLAVKTAMDKAKYLLLMDADFVFEPYCQPNKFRDFLKKADDDYFMIYYTGDTHYAQKLLVKSEVGWYYRYVTHECISVPDGYKEKGGQCNLFKFDHKCDGGDRSTKFERDIRMMKEVFDGEPENQDRYSFYLGESHKNLAYNRESELNHEAWLTFAEAQKSGKSKEEAEKEYDEFLESQVERKKEIKKLRKEALEWYQKRINFGGWFEEIYLSHYYRGKIMVLLEKPFEEWSNEMMMAHHSDNSRFEAIYDLVHYCRVRELYYMGYTFGKHIENNTFPETRVLFVDVPKSKYLFFFEYSICLFYVRRYRDSANLCLKIMKDGDAPSNIIDRVKKNLGFSMKYLKN